LNNKERDATVVFDTNFQRLSSYFGEIVDALRPKAMQILEFVNCGTFGNSKECYVEDTLRSVRSKSAETFSIQFDPKNKTKALSWKPAEEEDQTVVSCARRSSTNPCRVHNPDCQLFPSLLRSSKSKYGFPILFFASKQE
jgi:hypothetical protein